MTRSARTGTSPTVSSRIDMYGKSSGSGVSGARISPACGPHSAKHAQREVTSVSRHRAVLGQVAADPARVVVAERGAGDDLEQLLPDAGDREVALDPAPAVEHLGVGDRADVARDAVVAQPLEQLAGARAGDLELRERRLVEQARGLPGRAVLGADRRRPVHPRPAARPQRPGSPAAALDSYQLTRSQPDFSPNAAPWPRCQAYALEIRSGRPACRSWPG